MKDLDELTIRKDKKGLYTVYDRFGRAAHGFTRSAAIALYHSLYDEKDYSYHYDVDKTINLKGDTVK